MELHNFIHLSSLLIQLSLSDGVNPFVANISILYPLKIPEHERFSGVFKRFKMRTLARKNLTQINAFLFFGKKRKIYFSYGNSFNRFE